jgi:hypothetical protein
MTGLDSWLQLAARHLSKDSAAQVRTEIREHYDSAREAAIRGGATAGEADRLALTALGDAKTANRQYRRVLLTRAEARMLRNSDWEAAAICSRPWLKRFALAAPVAAVLAAAVLYLSGAPAMARVLLVGGIAMSPLCAALLLPVNTPARGRVFRCVKWVAMAGAMVLAFGPDALQRSWLLISCLWPLVWIEGTRASLRRKLPVAKWPRQLYL